MKKANQSKGWDAKPQGFSFDEKNRGNAGWAALDGHDRVSVF